jgi:hypothetical protein
MRKIIAILSIIPTIAFGQKIDSNNKAPIQPVLLYDAMGNVADTATQLFVYPSVVVVNGTVTITAVLKNRLGGGIAQPITYTSTSAEYDAWDTEEYLFRLANKRIYGNKLVFVD